MCDEQTLKDWEQHLKNKPVTRRRFNTLTLGAGLAAVLPPLANAQRISQNHVEIETPDGIADCFMAHPPSGSHPGIVLWPDILGLRPAFMDVGRQLAGNGYAVLVVNPYYRDAKAPVVPSTESRFSDPEVRDIVIPLAKTLNAETHFTDARAFVEYLEDHSAVSATRGIGTVGYCMGGPIAMRTAAARPDRVAAVSILHGAGLVTKEEDSPHLLISRMTAEFLVAIAESDDAEEPATKAILRDTFDAAGLDAEVKVFEGVRHGWTVPDSPAFSRLLAQDAWDDMVTLFEDALGEQV